MKSKGGWVVWTIYSNGVQPGWTIGVCGTKRGINLGHTHGRY